MVGRLKAEAVGIGVPQDMPLECYQYPNVSQ